MFQGLVLYVYRCPACGSKGEERLVGDGHDGAKSACARCGEGVTLEWDGGVTFEVTKGERKEPTEGSQSPPSSE